MSEIISRTPVWVFVIFFTLVLLGLKQTKERRLGIKQVFILPVAMMVFSLFGVYSAFGVSFLSISSWAVGSIMALMVGLRLGYPKAVRYQADDNSLIISGSWTPLILMMAIFFTKYFVGFALATNLPMIKQDSCVCIVCGLYGVFSGVFLARGISTWNVMPKKR